MTSGVCACVVILTPDRIVTGHVGDCRAVFAPTDGGPPIQLTCDHTISNPVEKDRVADYITSEGYVAGLMVTRSLGNFHLGSFSKCEGQLPVPSLSSVPRRPGLLLIASDGLLDVMSNESAIEFLRRSLRRPSGSVQTAADEIVTRAIVRGSMDNIGVILVKVFP